METAGQISTFRIHRGGDECVCWQPFALRFVLRLRRAVRRTDGPGRGCRRRWTAAENHLSNTSMVREKFSARHTPFRGLPWGGGAQSRAIL